MNFYRGQKARFVPDSPRKATPAPCSTRKKQVKSTKKSARNCGETIRCSIPSYSRLRKSTPGKIHQRDKFTGSFSLFPERSYFSLPSGRFFTEWLMALIRESYHRHTDCQDFFRWKLRLIVLTNDGYLASVKQYFNIELTTLFLNL